MIAARAYWRGVMTMLLFFVLSSLLSLVWEGVAFEAQVVVGGADMLVVLFLVYNHSMAMIMESISRRRSIYHYSPCLREKSAIDFMFLGIAFYDTISAYLSISAENLSR